MDLVEKSKFLLLVFFTEIISENIVYVIKERKELFLD